MKLFWGGERNNRFAMRGKECGEEGIDGCGNMEPGKIVMWRMCVAVPIDRGTHPL